MRQKIHSNKGFTLSEMLMTVLIIALVTSVIGGGVMVVQSVYRNVTLKAEAQTLRSTAITAVVNELRYAENISRADGLVEFDSPSRGYRIQLKEGENKEITVYSMITDTSVPLVTSKTKTDGLEPRLEQISYNPEEGTFSVKVVIYNGTKPYVGNSNDSITIRPVNTQDVSIP